MSDYAPLIMIGGFLAFGRLFSYGSDISDAIAAWWRRKHGGET